MALVPQAVSAKLEHSGLLLPASAFCQRGRHCVWYAVLGSGHAFQESAARGASQEAFGHMLRMPLRAAELAYPAAEGNQVFRRPLDGADRLVARYAGCMDVYSL